jgi:hypothetical protein
MIEQDREPREAMVSIIDLPVNAEGPMLPPRAGSAEC